MTIPANKKFSQRVLHAKTKDDDDEVEEGGGFSSLLYPSLTPFSEFTSAFETPFLMQPVRLQPTNAEPCKLGSIFNLNPTDDWDHFWFQGVKKAEEQIFDL